MRLPLRVLIRADATSARWKSSSQPRILSAMSIQRMDPKAASTLFAEQAKAQGLSAKTVASLLRASLADPSLAKVADSVASSVYEAASKALAQIKGIPLDTEAVKAGKEAVGAIHDALVDMAKTREDYWSAYASNALPKNVQWLPAPSNGGRVEELAKQLATEAKNGPVAFKVNSHQVMFARPGEDGAAVFERWEEAMNRAESGGALGGMRHGLNEAVTLADGLRAMNEAAQANPEGRPTAVLIADLDERARSKYAPEPAPPTAYIGMGLKTLVHPKEMERLLDYAAKDVRDHHETSVAQFLGNVQYQMGHGLNRPGTDDAWRAAMTKVRDTVSESER